MNASWMRDAAVAIADAVDTPDFQNDPSGNASTIDLVFELLLAEAYREHGVTLSKNLGGGSDGYVNGQIVGRVWKNDRSWHWMAFETRRGRGGYTWRRRDSVMQLLEAYGLEASWGS